MKLHVMRGLPASGKSAFAKKLVADTGNTVRINRDDLRSLCFDSKWTRFREQYIISVEKVMAISAFQQGMNVVIDDTNLANNIWPEFGKQAGVEVVVHDFTNVPLAECLIRDWERGNPASVGPGVIYRMAAQAGLLPWTGRPIAVSDLDGTLCDLTHRLKYIDQVPKDYSQFYALVGKDLPIGPIIEQIILLSTTHDLVFVTGRPDTCSTDTLAWIQKFVGIPFVGILMRRGGDRRPDFEVKEELLGLLPKERIAVVYDDRPSVINKVWKKHGLNVVAVNQEHWEGRE